MEILAKMITQSNIDNYRLQNEKKIIANEINYRKDKIKQYIGKLMKQVLFKNTILKESVIGNVKSLKPLEKYHLLSYLINRYTPENIVVGVTGKLGNNQPSTIINKIKEYFDFKRHLQHYSFEKEDYKYKEYKDLLKYFENINKNNIKQIPNVVKNLNWGYHNIIHNTNSAYIYLVFPCQGLIETNLQDQKINDLQDFISDYLDLGMSGKLFEIIREEEFLTYNINCNVSKYSHFGLFTIDFSVNCEKKLINKSLELLFKIIDNLKKKILDEKDIKKLIIKLENRKKTKNFNSLQIGLKRAEFVLFNNIKTKYFNNNYYQKLTIKKNSSLQKKESSSKKIIKIDYSSLEIKKYANQLFDYTKMGLVIVSPKQITKKDINYAKLLS